MSGGLNGKRFLIETGIMDVVKRTGSRLPYDNIWKFLLHPQPILDELRILIDYLSFKQGYGSFLAKGADLADPTKKLLVVSLSNLIPQVKMEAVLAKALQLRGCTPLILTHRSCYDAFNYFRLFGFDQFVFFEDFLQKSSEESCSKIVKDLLNQVSTRKSLLELKYHGVNIGNHVLSTITRSFHKVRIEISDPQIKGLLKRMLYETIRRIMAAEVMLDRIGPEILLFNEKFYIWYGPIYDIALNRGLNIIQFVGSHRDDAWNFKRYTKETTKMHPVSFSDETFELIRHMHWTDQHESELMQELKDHYKAGTWFNRQRLQQGKKLKSKEEIQRQLDLDPGKKTAVVFSHVLWDATFFYGEDIFDDYEEWLVETVKAACSNKAVNWVIKLHPANVWRLEKDNFKGEFLEHAVFRDEIGRLPDHIRLLNPDTDINTFSLFEVTDYCLTVRGTIGVEMPCFGIPVFTAGTGRYSGYGFTIDSATRDDYLEKLHHIQDFPKLSQEQVILAKKHAYALFKLRPFKLETIKVVYLTDRKATHPLDPKIEICAKSFDDLLNAKDLKAFSEWAVDEEKLDFLMPFPNSSNDE